MCSKMKVQYCWENITLFVGWYWPNQLFRGVGRGWTSVLHYNRNKSHNLLWWQATQICKKIQATTCKILGVREKDTLRKIFIKKCIIDKGLLFIILITYELAKINKPTKKYDSGKMDKEHTTQLRANADSQQTYEK